MFSLRKLLIIILIALLLVLSTGIIVYISLVNANKVWFENLVLTAAALGGGISVITGVITLFDFFDRKFGPDYPLSNKKIAKKVLRQISEYNYHGIKKDLIRVSIHNQFSDRLSEGQVIQLLSELSHYSLIIDIDDSKIAITPEGAKFMKRL